MKYKQFTVITNSEYADIISLDMIEAGSEGTSVTDANDVKEVLNDTKFWDYYDESILTDDRRVYVRGFFGETDDLSALAERIAAYGAAAGSLEMFETHIDSADYENEWRKYYQPIEIGRVVIVPKWLTYAGDSIPVRLDPGMAFGTGNHETTRMCIELMQDFDLTGKTVYDIGCGSGILGIAAAKLGAGRVLMSDIDENALKATGENAALNDVRCEITPSAALDGITEPADIVIANITADVLISLKNLFKRLLKPCGILIISGIIDTRSDDIANAFAPLFTVERALAAGDWRAYTYRSLQAC